MGQVARDHLAGRVGPGNHVGGYVCASVEIGDPEKAIACRAYVLCCAVLDRSASNDHFEAFSKAPNHFLDLTLVRRLILGRSLPPLWKAIASRSMPFPRLNEVAGYRIAPGE